MESMFQLLLLFVLSEVVAVEDTLIFAAVIYRHGARTPVDTYPNDPYANESLWPVQFGELTNEGKKQHYEFGKWLRIRYTGLLSKKYNPKQVRVQSTDVDRTLMSAEANLAGMFPPDVNSTWTSELKWQPIPIHTKPENDDEVLAMKKKCLSYDIELANIKNSPEYQKNLSRYQKLMKDMEGYTGKEIKDYYDILDIYTTLKIEQNYFGSLPDWTRKYFPDLMWKPACHSFVVPVMSPKLARLRAGPLLKEIVGHIERASRGSSPLKMAIYSAHDLTIGVILTALRVFDGKCPVFTSAIFFELFKDLKSHDLFIKVSYRNTISNADPTVLKIPDCEPCSLHRFKELYQYLLTVNFDEECKSETTMLSPEPASIFPNLLLLQAFAVLGMVGSFYFMSRLLFSFIDKNQISPYYVQGVKHSER